MCLIDRVGCKVMQYTKETGITMRKMDFKFLEDNIELVVVKDQPTLSALLLGTSMFLKYLEPYLIKNMKKAVRRVEDPQLKEEMQAFCAQETEHFQQHERFNGLVRNATAAKKEVLAYEALIDAEYRYWTAAHSLEWNIAYAEGFEAMTCALARSLFDLRTLDDSTPEFAELMGWHLIEEIEHRSVAFDAYKAIGHGYFYRVGMSIYAQYHFLKTVWVLGHLTLSKDEELKKRYSGWKARIKNFTGLTKVLALTVGRTLLSYSPFYHPKKIKINYRVIEEGKKYTEQSLEHKVV